MSRGNEVCDINSHGLFGWSWCLQLLILQFTAFCYEAYFLCPPSRTRHPGSCYPSDVDAWSDLCWGLGSVIHRGAVRRPAAVIQDWLMSLWQRTERAMLVSAGSQTLLQDLLLLPPSLSVTISLSVPHSLLLSLSCLVHLSHYNTNTLEIYNLSNHVLLWLNGF